MTLELHDEDASDSEALIIAWLTPLGRTALEFDDDSPMPFRRVQDIVAEDDCDLFNSTVVVSVDTLCSADDALAAKQQADLTHRRIMYLVRHAATTVELLDGRVVGFDYIDVVQRPLWIEYENDQILCKQSRYEIGSMFVVV